MTRSTKKPGAHTWAFTARFRRGAYGWKSSKLAVRRVREAVKEIRGVARRDPVLGAEGAILFLERVSAGLEHVDSSSGALGNAVNRAVEALVSVIADAPADEATREAWLERLFEAHREDVIPYIESLADHWGELCVAPKLASEWADRLLDTTRMVLGPDRRPGGFFHGTSACLSALYHARRYEELVELLEGERFWAYKRWAVKALAAMDRADDAIRCAEACRGSWTPDGAVDALCEEILLDAGRVGEAYARYGLWANRRNTYLATFRAVAKKYPHKEPAQLLADLVDSTPGEEGKWFATAKEAELYDEALALARESPCDPRTLARAARDLAEERPSFAVEAGLPALRWLATGYGYEITSADVYEAYRRTMEAAGRVGSLESTRKRIHELLDDDGSHEFVVRMLRASMKVS